MAYEKRFVDNLIGGMIIRIAKFGETVTAGNTVGEGAKPDAPTPEKPGPWLTLGKIKTATSERQKKTATVEGVNDAGFYEMRDLSIAQQSKLVHDAGGDARSDPAGVRRGGQPGR